MTIMKNLKLTTFTILVIICLAAPHAGAKSFRSGGPSRQFGGGFAGLKTFIELNLSETQQTEVLGIIENYQDKKRTTLENLKEARDNLRNVLKSEPFNADSARVAFRQISSIQEEMLILRMQMKSEIKAILTPEQSELLKEKKERRFARMKDRMEHRLEKINQ